MAAEAPATALPKPGDYAASADSFWIQTMYRVKDAAKSIEFYTTHFNFRLLDQFELGDRTEYILTTDPAADGEPAPGTPEAHTALFARTTAVLNLTHVHGTESDDTQYDNGNNEPRRGFGHIAVTIPDVYASCAELEAKGVAFKKRPDEGRMKGLAFALDPDGYWIEIIRRSEGSPITGFTLNQTMIRIKDYAKSLPFYAALGLSTVCARHFDAAKFSLYFLVYLPAGTTLPEDGMDYTKSIPYPVLELTHNHGTESDPEFSYHDGNTDPVGFGHLVFTTTDVAAKVEELTKVGGRVLEAGAEKTVLADPDGYHVHLYPTKSA